MDRAQKELNIEKQIKKIEDTWSVLALLFTPLADSDIMCLQVSDTVWWGDLNFSPNNILAYYIATACGCSQNCNTTTEGSDRRQPQTNCVCAYTALQKGQRSPRLKGVHLSRQRQSNMPTLIAATMYAAATCACRSKTLLQRPWRMTICSCRT